MLAALALLAMGARALIPAGYMLAPGEGAGRYVTVTLCAAHGLVEAVLDRRTGELSSGQDAPRDDDRSGSPETPCAFSAIAQLAPPESPQALAIAGAFQVAAPNRRVATAAATELAAPPPWSTGPPRAV